MKGGKTMRCERRNLRTSVRRLGCRKERTKARRESQSEGKSQGREGLPATYFRALNTPLFARPCSLPHDTADALPSSWLILTETQTMLRISFLSEDALTATCVGGVPHRRADTSQGVKTRSETARPREGGTRQDTRRHPNPAVVQRGLQARRGRRKGRASKGRECQARRGRRQS